MVKKLYSLKIIQSVILLGAITLFCIFMSSMAQGEEEIQCRESGRAVSDNRINDISISGDYAFVADHNGFGNDGGLLIINISDKINPERISKYPSPELFGVMILDDYAYLADDSNGFIILDVSDKANPKKTGEYIVGVQDVVVVEEHAYLALSRGGLLILDITDKNDPVKVGECETDGYSKAVAVDDGYAYLAEYYNGLVIIDISNKSDPVIVSTYVSGDYMADVDVHDNYAYVADPGEGGKDFFILNVTNKSDPRETASFATPGGTNGVSVQGDYAYLGDAGNNGQGLIVLNIEQKSDPREIARFRPPGGNIPRVLASGDHVYIGHSKNTGNGAIIIVELLPIAYMDEVNPGLVLLNGSVHFEGHGNCKGDRNIAGYSWSSDIYGEFSNADSLDYADLPPGEHTIGFKVLDDHSFWSQEVTSSVIVHRRPVALIDPRMPRMIPESAEMNFIGNGTDDGHITNYSWHSDVEGILYNGTEQVTNISNLSVGIHIITLTVMDNYGVWSYPAVTDLTVLGKPKAIIENIEPSPVRHGVTVYFQGGGVAGGEIVRFVWRSSIDKEFINETVTPSTFSALSVGTHVISLRVLDNFGYWSESITMNLSVLKNQKPVAFINGIAPNPVNQSDDVIFNGSGTDDGSIIRYVWISSLDGEIYNGSERSFTSSNLKVGHHTISFMVQDDNNVWSDPVNASVVVQVKQNDENEKERSGDEQSDDDNFIPGFQFVLSIASIVTTATIMESRNRKRK